MNENLGDSNASRFVDIKLDENKKPVVDEEAMELLNHLKNEKIPSKLNRASNVFKFKVVRKMRKHLVGVELSVMAFVM